MRLSSVVAAVVAALLPLSVDSDQDPNAHDELLPPKS